MTNPHIKVMTPCFGAQVTSTYATSLLNLVRACRGRAVGVTWWLHGGDALITRARAECVAHFLSDPGATHLLFIDADMGFQPDQVFRLLDFDADVTAAAYPLKAISWDRLGAAVKSGHPDPETAALHYVPGLGRVDGANARSGFDRIPYAGTGFLLIRRAALIQMCAAYAARRYRTVVGPSHSLDDSPYRIALFDPIIEPETGVYLGEDYSFCRRWTDLGGEIWLDLRSKLTHVGPTAFEGNFFGHHPRAPGLPDSPVTSTSSSFPIRQSRGQKATTSLRVVTPCYNGRVSAYLAVSLLELLRACRQRGIGLSWDLRVSADYASAKGDGTAGFLEDPEATHLLFVGADIGFPPDQVFRLLDLGAEVSAAAYPITRLDWDRVAIASNERQPSPAASLLYDLDGPEGIALTPGSKFVRIPYVGLGFVMLRRSAVVQLAQAYAMPKSATFETGATTTTGGFVGPRLFASMVEPETGRYLSEDFAFCRRWTELGGQIWLDVHSELTHVGPMSFRGDLFSQLEPVPATGEP